MILLCPLDSSSEATDRPSKLHRAVVPSAVMRPYLNVLGGTASNWTVLPTTLSPFSYTLPIFNSDMSLGWRIAEESATHSTLSLIVPPSSGRNRECEWNGWSLRLPLHQLHKQRQRCPGAAAQFLSDVQQDDPDDRQEEAHQQDQDGHVARD